MADAENGEDDSPDWCLRLLVEAYQETASHCRDDPATPDGPAVTTEAGRDERDDDAAGQEEASDGEDVEAGLGRSAELDGGEVEGDVVERAEEL